MPHIPEHPSARKRHRQNLKRRERNRTARTRVRSAIKRALDAIASGDPGSAAERVREAARALDKARTKGVMHRNAASRHVARLSAKLAKIAKS
jgi:small subunit ribosomal protein S20